MTNCPECSKPMPEGYKVCPACGGSTVRLADGVAAHINLLRKKIGQEPKNIKLRMDLGGLYLGQGLLLEARDEFEKAVAADPRDFDAHFKLAQVLMRMKQGDKAEKEFSAALHINPKSTDVLTGLFRSYFLEGKTDPAIVLGEKVLKTNPDNVEFHKLLKELYKKKGDEDMALKELLALSTLIPEDLPVIREITGHYLAKRDYDKAAVYYGRMINMAAADPALGIPIGEYYFDLNQYDRTIEYLAPLLDLTDVDLETRTTIRSHLCLAYLNQGNTAEALKIAEDLKRVNPGEMKPEIRKMLSAFYTRVGHEDLADKRRGKSAAHFETAVHYDAENEEAAGELMRIRAASDTKRSRIVKRAGIIASGAVVLILVLVLARVATRGRIILKVDPAVPVVLSIDGRVAKGTVGRDGAFVSPLMSVGRHRVTVESEGYEKWTGSIDIGLAKNARRTISLAPLYYELKIRSMPDSSVVTINGQPDGKTPYLNGRVLVRTNTVCVTRDHYAGWCTTFTAKKGDVVDLGEVALKNLSGSWSGRIGKEAYAYDASFRMAIVQKGADLSVDYFHKPVEGYTYSGKIYGVVKPEEVVIQGELTYRYRDVFRWERIKRKIVLRGKVSDDWDRIEGQSQVDGLGDQPWWAERVK